MKLTPFVKNWIEEDFDSELMHAEEQKENLTEIFEYCTSLEQQTLLLRGHIFFNSTPNFSEDLHLNSNSFFEPHYLGFNVKLFPNYDLELKGDEFNRSDPNYTEKYHNDLLVRIIRWSMNSGEWEKVSTRSIQIRDKVDKKNRIEMKNFGLKVLSISKEEINDREKLDEFYLTLSDKLLTDIRDYADIRDLKFY